MHVEKLTSPEDIRRMTELAKQYDGGFSQHIRVDVEYSVKQYVHMTGAGWGVVFALKDGNGEIVGGLGAIKGPDLHCGAMTAIETFWFTNPDSRGHGLLLLDAFEAWARENGCPRIAIVHLEDSMPERLSVLYRRRGYKLVESHYVKGIEP